MNNSEDIPVVSILVLAYNHEKYIGQALDSFLIQQTAFKFEIIIGEDDSQDKTRDICKDYKSRYPDKIRLLLNDRKNVIHINGKPTGNWNLLNLLNNATGKYIALCDGDDYWTDSLKLQKQVDFLETNLDYVICYHKIMALTIEKNKGILTKQDTHREVYSITDLCEGCTIPTASILFRNHLVKEFPKWYYTKALWADSVLFPLVAQHGKIKRLPDYMSVYRVHDTSFMRTNFKDYEWGYHRLVINKMLDKHFKYKYHAHFFNRTRAVMLYNDSYNRARLKHDYFGMLRYKLNLILLKFKSFLNIQNVANR